MLPPGVLYEATYHGEAYYVLYDGSRAVETRAAAAEVAEQRERGAIVKAVRQVLRSAAFHRAYSLAQIRERASTIIGYEVELPQTNNAVWVLRQNGEIECVASRKGETGHSYDPHSTFYRWKESHATTPD
jgi:hypothetical protein